MGEGPEERKEMLRTAACVAGIALLAPVALAGIPELSTQRIITGLSRPVLVTAPPDDSDRIFILEQRSGSTGRIRIFDLTTNSLLSTPFLSVTVSTSSEQGLLGLAFHPDYAENRYFFINYTNSSGDTVIARYQAYESNPNLANPSSAQTVMTIDQPYTNHNGGGMEFGPDGYLWIATGDGGSGGDPGNRAQNINNLLGKMLRIDVDTLPYSNPPDNPFVGTSGLDEIHSYGWRNAWRFSFDRLTGDAYVADVGQNAWEEVDVIPAGGGLGGNYGWRCYEGNAAYNTSGCPSASTMIFPVHQYSHGGSPFRCSITGGYVYRGSAIPSLQGTYFFADYCSNQIWTCLWDGGDGITNLVDRTSELASTNGGSISAISSFGEDASGNLYICDLNGEVFRIQAEAPEGACCVNNVCITVPESNCNAGGGEYLGDDVECTDDICIPPPANDECDASESIGAGATDFTTEYATDSPDTDCSIGADIWLRYTADCTGTMLVSVLGDFFDVESAVYGQCPSSGGSLIACGESAYVVPVTEGESYLIRLGSVDGSTGSGSVTINCIPGNDPCDGDCDGDGVVNVDDVLQMLGDFGGASDCDTNGDGIIGVDDLLTMLGNWGDC